MSIRALWACFLAGFRRWSAYRAATAAGAFTNTMFGLTKASITVAAIGAAGGTLAGYDVRAGATYAWLTQALLGPVYVFHWDELAQRVRTGDIAVDFARPVDLQLSWLAADLGRAAVTVLPRGIPPIVVGALTFGLTGPDEVDAYVLGALSIVLAVSISFLCRFAVNLCAFWLIEIRGALTLYMVVSGVLCGLIIPVHWFPSWLKALANATPFPSTLQTPVDILSGRVTGVEAVGVFVVQIGWLVATLVLGRLVLARGTHRLVVQGG
ncbi:MAG TPA: ABC-2 family transporter protein [Mycobacteriales bacterium]|nr:ABC-2 family transporter protein [Mycobacteriales bacterium]